MITSILVAYNLNKILYPWKEAIASVLPISEKVIVVDCGSTDGTAEEAAKIERVEVAPFHWGDKSEIIAEATNYGIALVKTEWHLNIQGDEVLHEDGYEEIKWLTQSHYSAGRIKYKHFVHDFNTTFNFMYQSAIRIARTGSKWRSIGDGVEYAGGSPAGVYRFSRAVFFHYGKVDVGRAREAAAKEREFQELFVHLNLGFPDPLVVAAADAGQINYAEIFRAALERGEFKPFTGTHPAAARTYIRARTGGTDGLGDVGEQCEAL